MTQIYYDLTRILKTIKEICENPGRLRHLRAEK